MDHKNPSPRPGNYDRSWNDPPLFSYASGTQTSTESKKVVNKLNKRVGFPSSNNSTSTASGNKQLLNPLIPPVHSEQLEPTDSLCSPQIMPQIPSPTVMCPSSETTSSNKPLLSLPYDDKNTAKPYKYISNSKVTQSEESIVDVETLVANLNKVVDNISPDMDEKKIIDVKKRMATMEAKWKDDQLNAEVQNGMANMVKCLLLAQDSVDKLCEESDQTKATILLKDSLAEAENIQRSLTVDHPSLCGTWMVGIKHLVQEVKRILMIKRQLEPEQIATGIKVPL